MLSLPGGGGGGRGEGGGAIHQGDSLQGVRRERGGEGLTQHFFPNNSNLAATATTAAATTAAATSTAIIAPTSLGNKPSLLTLPAGMASPPSRPLIAPSLSPTTPSPSASKKKMVKPCSDHTSMATAPLPPTTPPTTGSAGVLPSNMTSAAVQVKLTLAESQRMTPVTPHPFPPRSGSSSRSVANDTASKHVDDDDDDTRAEKVDNHDNSDDNNDDDDVNNNNNNSVTYHPGISSLDVLAVTTTTTMTKAMDVAETPEQSSGGGPVRNLRVRGQRKFLPEKTRHKRQTLQDMTRPLKQWLIRHKDNPYPSKAQKMDLVSKSHMTLTQVSNWFANARRRLKNTVKQPDLSWACRIKLYNSCVEGNAELFSLCSDDDNNDDSCLESDDDMMEHRQSDTFHDDVTDSMTSSRTATPDVTGGSGEACSSFNHGSNGGNHHSNNNHHDHHHSHQLSHSSSSSSNNSGPSCSGPSGPQPCPGLEDSCSSFPKYKHSILHRYLSDSHHQALILDEDSVAKSRDRHHSSSTGSRDFEELSTSSVSSPAHESVHHDHLDDFSEEFETMALRRRTSDVSSSSTAREEDMYWKEIGAALALTSLAKGRGVRI